MNTDKISQKATKGTKSEGWAVQIRRKDGSTFMASGAEGDVTPVWSKRNRKYAVRYKRLLKGEGLNARVVPVVFTSPEIPQSAIRSPQSE